MSAQAMRHRRRRSRTVTVYLARERPDESEYGIEARCVIHPGRAATLLDPPEAPEVEVVELWIDGNAIDPSDLTADEEAAIFDEVAAQHECEEDET